MIKSFSLISLIGVTLIFLSMSFIKWNINPSTWGSSDRFGFILFSLSWLGIAGIIAAGIQESKNK